MIQRISVVARKLLGCKDVVFTTGILYGHLVTILFDGAVEEDLVRDTELDRGGVAISGAFDPPAKKGHE